MQNKKESIVDFKHFLNQSVVVQLIGDRNVSGKLENLDKYSNLVLSSALESCGANTRNLGLVVIKGSMITSLSPGTTWKSISDPFK